MVSYWGFLVVPTAANALIGPRGVGDLLVFNNLSLVLVFTYDMPTSLSITCTRLSSLMMVSEMLIGTT